MTHFKHNIQLYSGIKNIYSPNVINITSMRLCKCVNDLRVQRPSD